MTCIHRHLVQLDALSQWPHVGIYFHLNFQEVEKWPELAQIMFQA